jgi:EF-P beta-lysylation protein EpmB
MNKNPAQRVNLTSVARTAPTTKPHGWREALKRAHRHPDTLLAALGLSDQADAFQPDHAAFKLLVPEAFVRRMEIGNINDPLLQQVLPHRDETQLEAGYHTDPVGDHASHQGGGVLRKYHGRALVITTGACAVHCRYCFRQHFPYATESSLHQGWLRALEAIAQDTSINEVILSGGDPLMLSERQLSAFTDGLAQLPHVRRLRLHTRVPVVLPERIDDHFMAWLRGLPWPVVMVIHANHPNEFDDALNQAMQRLRPHCAALLNQAVLLAGINDRAPALIELAERSFTCGVLPYYLHQLDRVQGAQRFAVSDDHALALMDILRRQLPGYLVPRLVREAAGQPYKLPML